MLCVWLTHRLCTCRIDTALSGISHLALRSSVRDDDGIDQLHHFVTVTMLAFFAAIAGFKVYASEPINCWNYGNYLYQHYQVRNDYCKTHLGIHYHLLYYHGISINGSSTAILHWSSQWCTQSRMVFVLVRLIMSCHWVYLLDDVHIISKPNYSWYLSTYLQT